MTAADFSAKWDIRFQDNVFFLISEADLREFKDDLLVVFGVGSVNVPVYVPGTTYAQEYLVRYTPAGKPEGFYYALQAGQLQAPDAVLAPGSPPEWKQVPGPVAATALWQPITLVQAQGMEGTGVEPGRRYQVDFGPDPNGVTQHVYLEGLEKLFDTTRGVLEVGGVRSAIEDIDLAAGTWKLKPPSGLLREEIIDIYSVQTTYAVAATQLNTSLFIYTYAGATIILPPLTDDDVPALLRIEHFSRRPPGYNFITVPGLARPLGHGEHALFAAVATPYLPAPTGGQPTPAGRKWVVVSEPPLPTTIARNISLTDAQKLALNPPYEPRVVSNVLYAIESTKWNGKDGATVYVHGLHPSSYAPVGYTLVKGVYVLVAVDVAAGTFEAGGALSGQAYTAGANITISATGEISTQVATPALPAGTPPTLLFTQDAEYPPLYSGTFGVDTTGKRIGKVVVAYLGPACTQPVLDPQVFRTKNTYVGGKTLEYCFKVSSTGYIEYIITVLD